MAENKHISKRFYQITTLILVLFIATPLFAAPQVKRAIQYVTNDFFQTTINNLNKRISSLETRINTQEKKIGVSNEAQQKGKSKKLGTQQLLKNNAFLKGIMSRVVKIVCRGKSFRSSGTGFIWASGNSNNSGEYLWSIATNAHVLITDNPDYPNCYVYMPVGPNYTVEESGRMVTLITAAKENYPELDFALLFVNDGYKIDTAGKGLMPCEYNITIGDPVHVIGYPTYGDVGDSHSSITVTEGIISGFIDTRFGRIYKTSAKIDSGNSGGIAVNIERECTYGQPTWVMEGNFSGLGLIQSNEMIQTENLK